MSTPFLKINNFVCAHADAKHFEKDRALFEKTFPQSRLIPSLQNPFHLKRKELDERMIMEILQNSDITPEAILANRADSNDDANDNGTPGTDGIKADTDDNGTPETDGIKADTDDNGTPDTDGIKADTTDTDSNDDAKTAREKAEAILLNANVPELDYHNEMLPLVFDLELKFESRTKKDLIEVLTAKQNELVAATLPTTTGTTEVEKKS